MLWPLTHQIVYRPANFRQIITCKKIDFLIISITETGTDWFGVVEGWVGTSDSMSILIGPASPMRCEHCVGWKKLVFGTKEA